MRNLKRTMPTFESVWKGKRRWRGIFFPSRIHGLFIREGLVPAILPPELGRSLHAEFSKYGLSVRSARGLSFESCIADAAVYSAARDAHLGDCLHAPESNRNSRPSGGANVLHCR